MADFGGLGGVWGGRERNTEDLFEAAIERCFGKQLRDEGMGEGWPAYDKPRKLGQRIWGSLANVDWAHENGDTASYSFRAAGDLIASIVGAGDYMDWYCSAPDGCVDEQVAEELAKEGWRPTQIGWPAEPPPKTRKAHPAKKSKRKAKKAVSP